VSPELNRQSL